MRENHGAAGVGIAFFVTETGASAGTSTTAVGVAAVVGTASFPFDSVSAAGVSPGCIGVTHSGWSPPNGESSQDGEKNWPVDLPHCFSLT